MTTANLKRGPGSTGGSVVTMQGDINGPSNASVVQAISGRSPLTIAPSALTWLGSTATPSITQATPASDIVTQDITISPQAPFASATTNKVCGNVTVNFAGNLAGYNANLNSFTLKTNGTEFLQFTPNGTGGAAFILCNSQLMIQPTGAFVARSGTSVNFQSQTSNSFGDINGLHAMIYTGATSSTLTFTNDITTSLTINQTAAVSTSSGNGLAGIPASVVAQPGQAATGIGNNGGRGGVLALSSGAGGTSGAATAGTAGSLQLQAGLVNMVQYDGYGEILTSTSVSVATTGTIALTAAQQGATYIICTGTLTGNATLQFSGVVAVNNCRKYTIDLSSVTLAGHTLTIGIGTNSTTAAITTITTNQSIMQLYCPTSNTCFLNI